MSSGQSNISTAAETESSGQQNPSGNAGSPVAESIAPHDNILQDEATVDTTSYVAPEDTESNDSDDNEELSGGLANDDRSGTSLQNFVPQEAAVEDMESIYAEIRTRFNQYIQTSFPEGLMNNRHVVEAFLFYAQQMNERIGSSTTPASTIEIRNGIPVQTASSEMMDSFHDFYASIRPHHSNADIHHFYVSSRSRQLHADIQDNYRNQAIDELLTPVLIDETQKESVLCPICDEKYDSSAKNGTSHGACMIPGCKHVFGRGCINIWLKDEKKSTCPMCRAEIDIPTDSSDVDDD